MSLEWEFQSSLCLLCLKTSRERKQLWMNYKHLNKSLQELSNSYQVSFLQLLLKKQENSKTIKFSLLENNSCLDIFSNSSSNQLRILKLENMWKVSIGKTSIMWYNRNQNRFMNGNPRTVSLKYSFSWAQFYKISFKENTKVKFQRASANKHLHVHYGLLDLKHRKRLFKNKMSVK